jgi:hypothetical protein
MRIPVISTQINSYLNVQSTDENKTSGDKTQKNENRDENTVSTLLTNEQPISGYNQKGQVTGVESNDQKEEGIFAKRERIKNEVWQQTYSMLQDAIAQYMSSGNSTDSNDDSQAIDPFGLGAYYTENPEDWEKVQQGIVPDYFNVENTGRRILDIWMPQGGTQDAESLQSARLNIERAYDEVSRMFGGHLPQLVLDTRDYILKKLDGMAMGEQAQ